jgi:hypothetical protein
MKPFIFLCACLVGCGVDTPLLEVDHHETGIAGRFAGELPVRFETVRVGDRVAARFLTEDSEPIAVAFDEDSVPEGWTDDRGDAPVDPKSYASSIRTTLELMHEHASQDELAALSSAAQLVDDSKATASAWGTRTWYSSCVPTWSGGEDALVNVYNGGLRTLNVYVNRVYGVRSGALYQSAYYVSIAKYRSHNAQLRVSNGANITQFNFGADGGSNLYISTQHDWCW